MLTFMEFHNSFIEFHKSFMEFEMLTLGQFDLPYKDVWGQRIPISRTSRL